MDPALETYLQQQGVNPDLRERVESLARYFEQMTGSQPASALLIPARDYIGNPCHEAWFFSDNALMNAGMLLKRPPSPRYEVCTYRGRVNQCILVAKHFDPAQGELAQANAQSELGLELWIHGRQKAVELRVQGPNCRQLALIVHRHIARNIV